MKIDFGDSTKQKKAPQDGSSNRSEMDLKIDQFERPLGDHTLDTCSRKEQISETFPSMEREGRCKNRSIVEYT